MITNYIKTAVRIFLRQKGVTLLNIFGFAFGILCSLIILIWVNYELSYDQFNVNKDRIYRVLEEQLFDGEGSRMDAQLPEWIYLNFANDIPEVEKACVLLPRGSIWTKNGDENIEIDYAYLTNNEIFDIFTFQSLYGQLDNALSNPNNVVITKSTSLSIFNKVNSVGEVFYDDYKVPFKVTAIINDLPSNSHFKLHMLISNVHRIEKWDFENYNQSSATYLLLKEGVSPENIQKKIDLLDEKYMPLVSDKIKFSLQSVQDIHLKSEFISWEINHKEFYYKYILIFIGIAIIVMIIASINFVNLTIAYSFKRIKEVGIRKALGSKKSSIVFQLLTESLMLSFISFWLAIIMTELLLPYLNEILNLDLKLVFSKNMMLVIQMLGLVLLAGIISGIYPALYISKLQPAKILKGQINVNSLKTNSRKYLVIFQLMLTSALIISSITVKKQVNFMINTDYGFDKEHIVLLPFYEEMQSKRELIDLQMLENPSIIDVAASCRNFGRSLWRNSIEFEGSDPTLDYGSPYSAVTPNFLKFYNIKLAEGRDFNERDVDTANKVYLVNETLVKSFQIEDPVGKRFRTADTKWGTIVGVIKDFNYKSLHHDINPMIYHIEPTHLYSYSVKINPKNISSALKHMEQIWFKYVPNKQFQYQFLDDIVENLYINESRTTKLISIFSFLAIIISCIGLLGLIIFFSLQKTKEIGIRKAHGAQIVDIILYLNSDFLKWAIIANLIACPVSYFILNKWLQNFAYAIDLKWWIFVLTAAVTLMITLITISWQSYKVARKNPVESLRYE